MEVLRNEIQQKNIQLQRLNADLEKLKNETSRTQSELKGEAGEINLCSLLENEFKDDIFERQKRGSSSGDIVQRIKTTAGIIDTPIVFDNKESQNITRSDLEKSSEKRMWGWRNRRKRRHSPFTSFHSFGINSPDSKVPR
jgi:hypothetical protein